MNVRWCALVVRGDAAAVDMVRIVIRTVPVAITIYVMIAATIFQGEELASVLVLNWSYSEDSHGFTRKDIRAFGI